MKRVVALVAALAALSVPSVAHATTVTTYPGVTVSACRAHTNAGPSLVVTFSRSKVTATGAYSLALEVDGRRGRSASSSKWSGNSGTLTLDYGTASAARTRFAVGYADYGYRGYWAVTSVGSCR